MGHVSPPHLLGGGGRTRKFCSKVSLFLNNDHYPVALVDLSWWSESGSQARENIPTFAWRFILRTLTHSTMAAPELSMQFNMDYMRSSLAHGERREGHSLTAPLAGSWWQTSRLRACTNISVNGGGSIKSSGLNAERPDSAEKVCEALTGMALVFGLPLRIFKTSPLLHPLVSSFFTLWPNALADAWAAVAAFPLAWIRSMRPSPVWKRPHFLNRSLHPRLCPRCARHNDRHANPGTTSVDTQSTGRVR
jgi:hypothetical protein